MSLSEIESQSQRKCYTPGMSTTGGTKHPSGPIPLWLIVGWGSLMLGLLVWGIADRYEHWRTLHVSSR